MSTGCVQNSQRSGFPCEQGEYRAQRNPNDSQSPIFGSFCDDRALVCGTRIVLHCRCGIFDLPSRACRPDRQPHRPLIIDVRARSEFDSGHIPDAVNIPLTELPSRLGEVEAKSDQEIVVYCEGGGRSMAAAFALRGAGFSTVLHLEGDMRAWRESQLPCAGC